jgi:hypothetical protein
MQKSRKVLRVLMTSRTGQTLSKCASLPDLRPRIAPERSGEVRDLIADVWRRNGITVFDLNT